MTLGKTVSWLFLLVGIIYLFHRRKLHYNIKNERGNIDRPTLKSVFKYTGVMLLWVSAIYLYLFISNCSIDGSYFRPIEVDNYHYAVLAKYLNKGYECMNIQAIITGNANLVPYHYAESWLTAFIIKIFNINPLFVYSVVTQCIVLVVILFGFLSIWEKKHTKISIFAILCIIFLLFVTDMAYIYKKFITSEYLYGANRAYIFIMLKESFLSLFFLASLLLFIEKKYCELFYSLLLILPLFFLAAPAIGGIIVGGLIMYYIKHKKIPWKYLFVSLILFTIFGIYVLTGSSDLGNSNRSGFISSIPWYKFRLLITNFILYVAQYFHFVVLILVLCNIKILFNYLKKLWIPIFCFWICTIVASVIVRGYNGIAVQIISSVYSSILSVLIPVVVLLLWNNLKIYSKIKKYFAYALVILSFSVGIYTINTIMSRQLYPIKESRRFYERQVVSKIKDTKPLKIGVISNYPGFDFINNIVTNYGTFQSYLDAYYNDVDYYQLNIPKEYFIEYETLYSLGLKRSNLNEDSFRENFVKKNQIDYIIVRHDAVLPDNLKTIFRLAAHDKTGELFYIKNDFYE
jgi:hypothetical protein